MRLLISNGNFALDPDHNPPKLRPIEAGDNDRPFVALGRHVRLRPDPRLGTLEALLNLRVEVDPEHFEGLGDVNGGCGVFCTTNYCRDLAVRRRWPSPVAKVVGVLAGEPIFILLTQPRLTGVARPRHESKTNRKESGLAHHILIEAGELECPICPSRNVGEIVVEP